MAEYLLFVNPLFDSNSHFAAHSAFLGKSEVGALRLENACALVTSMLRSKCKLRCDVKYRATKKSQFSETQQGVGGARPGQYFFREGETVLLTLRSYFEHPIRIRMLQKQVSEEEFNAIKKNSSIVLQAAGDPGRDYIRSINVGVVNVHKKAREGGENKSEEIMRVEITRMIDDDDKAWEEPNLLATLDIDYVVVLQNGEDDDDFGLTTMHKL